VTVSEARLRRARTVADAVLYEGYLLYPYRASSGKNRTRWQFGVLGPPGAAEVQGVCPESGPEHREVHKSANTSTEKGR